MALRRARLAAPGGCGIRWAGERSDNRSPAATHIHCAKNLKCLLLGLYAGSDTYVPQTDVFAAQAQAQHSRKHVEIVYFPNSGSRSMTALHPRITGRTPRKHGTGLSLGSGKPASTDKVRTTTRAAASSLGQTHAPTRVANLKHRSQGLVLKPMSHHGADGLFVIEFRQRCTAES